MNIYSNQLSGETNYQIMKAPVEKIIELWLKLTSKPKSLWFNFDTYILYFSEDNEDRNSNACVGVYTNKVLLLDFQEDIKETIKEESYNIKHSPFNDRY